MDCCSPNGLQQMFGRSAARRDLRRYERRGLDARARLLVAVIRRHGVEGASLLEIGCGIGALHMELLKAGAARAVGYEASSAYLEAARDLAERLGLQDRVQYRPGDFVAHAGEAEEADVVLLDRAICCYPDMQALVASSAVRARKLYVLTYPRPTWWVRGVVWAFNAASAALRREYRAFLHSPRDIEETVAIAGLTPWWQGRSGLWQVAAYRRQEIAPLA